jgi:hypothetical protein
MQEAFQKFPLAANKKAIEKHIEKLKQIHIDTEEISTALKKAKELSLAEAITTLQSAIAKYTNAYNLTEAQQQLDLYQKQASLKPQKEEPQKIDPLLQIIEEAKASTDLEIAIKILERGIADYSTSEYMPRAEALLTAYKEKLSVSLQSQKNAISNFIEKVQAIEDNSYVFYPAEDAPKIQITTITLYDSPLINRTALFKYILEAKLHTISEKDETTTAATMKIKITQIQNKPRIIIGSRETDLPVGTRLVVEYFVANPEEKKGYEYHSSEIISLPAISKGKLLSVDINGISYEKVDGRNTIQKIRNREKPLFGFIISLYSPDNLLLTQRYSSTKLSEECSHKINRE